MTLFQYIDSNIERTSPSKSASWKRKHYNALQAVKAYCNNKDVDLTSILIPGWIDGLKKYYSNQKLFSESTTRQYKDVFKSLYASAVNTGLLPPIKLNDLCSGGWDEREEQSYKNFDLLNQIKILDYKNLNKELSNIRDLYLLSMTCMGLELPTLISLDKSALQEDSLVIDGLRFKIPTILLDKISLINTKSEKLLPIKAYYKGEAKDAVKALKLKVRTLFKSLNLNLYQNESTFTDWLIIAKESGVSVDTIQQMVAIRQSAIRNYAAEQDKLSDIAEHIIGEVEQFIPSHKNNNRTDEPLQPEPFASDNSDSVYGYDKQDIKGETNKGTNNNDSIKVSTSGTEICDTAIEGAETCTCRRGKRVTKSGKEDYSDTVSSNLGDISSDLDDVTSDGNKVHSSGNPLSREDLTQLVFNVTQKLEVTTSNWYLVRILKSHLTGEQLVKKLKKDGILNLKPTDYYAPIYKIKTIRNGVTKIVNSSDTAKMLFVRTSLKQAQSIERIDEGGITIARNVRGGKFAVIPIDELQRMRNFLEGSNQEIFLLQNSDYIGRKVVVTKGQYEGWVGEIVKKSTSAIRHGKKNEALNDGEGADQFKEDYDNTIFIVQFLNSLKWAIPISGLEFRFID